MLNVAMIGLGWWGRKMTTLVQSHSDEMRIVRAVDPNVEASSPFAAENKIAFSASYEEALADPLVDAVILATPHSLHEAQIASAVRAGKHVFCEKPLALTRAGAEQSIAMCKEAGLVLGMGHERRFEPPVAEMLQLAASGQLGRLVQIEANFSHDKFLSLSADNWRLQPDHAPAAGMTATGIHLTDLAVKLMGPAKQVLVTCEQLASQLPSGDTMSALCRFQSGGTAYISASLSYPFISRFAVYGTRGWIDIRDRAHVEAPDGWVVTKGLAGQPITTTEVGKAEAVLTNLEAFAKAVKSGENYPITGEDMVNNIALLEAIIRGAKSGRMESVA
ncbi:Gfo/Idh/MocA family oxidoreductase [Paraburkholderia sp. LEh10]|uniref:Gfo/Idh/MocA family protein n=1 Tax=Paraburkholderia sp. LEh10 TaxID=2821353 RepID=UPI001AE87BFD|nr:Gfo/Idh/MocA family oxidoreductase [Paraburkholderia sp. LEh10]MBP0589462.1 Gfo/Idh/MocA family oxidoreductase [Paraburkholderia sp. LEh10]